MAIASLMNLTTVGNQSETMSKELKMLLITMTLFIAGVIYMYVSQHYHYRCETIAYQNLSGEHSMDVCEWINE